MGGNEHFIGHHPRIESYHNCQTLAYFSERLLFVDCISVHWNSRARRKSHRSVIYNSSSDDGCGSREINGAHTGVTGLRAAPIQVQPLVAKHSRRCLCIEFQGPPEELHLPLIQHLLIASNYKAQVTALACKYYHLM